MTALASAEEAAKAVKEAEMAALRQTLQLEHNKEIEAMRASQTQSAREDEVQKAIMRAKREWEAEQQTLMGEAKRAADADKAAEISAAQDAP